MPEANIPSLQLPTGASSSETDASSTERSNTSSSAGNAIQKFVAADNNSDAKKKTTPQTKKSKKSAVARRSLKKQPLKASGGYQKLPPLVGNLKTHIPRPLLLTPSTSSTSLLTPRSSGRTPISSSASNASNSKPSTPRPQLQRQHSAAIIKFCARKSVSQMDIKQARRNGNYPIQRLVDPDQSSTALVPSSISLNMGASSQTSLMNKLLDPDSNYYFLMQERDSRCAGIRIFATIMLNAWRKRRDEVKRLAQQVDDLKRSSIKAKNQLHVFNTLFRVEQRRNDDLNCQLKRSLEDINNAKSSCETLTTSLISVKADKALMEQELGYKEQEFEGLNEMLKQTKSELFKAMGCQRDLQSRLSAEQRRALLLENQKNELINEICETNVSSMQTQENLSKELLSKANELAEAQAVIVKYEALLVEMQSKDLAISQYAEVETKLQQEVDTLQTEACALRKCLGSTVDQRLKTCWCYALFYQRATVQMLHLMLFCMLPAIPSPQFTKFPMGLTIDRALKFIRR